jgi:hypothetical protein
MRNRNRTLTISFIILLLVCNLFPISSNACKDVVAVNNTTAGDYNLFMKVRDPSRPGFQVLCIIPKGTTYQYHHPWNGKTLTYTVQHSYIGICTENDILPNIVKAGMVLSTTGIAYGDADSGSRWINPTRYAWDDFDWIRYACQQATTEQQAVDLLTSDCVDKLHATGVSETLFVVGPNKAYVIEADAWRYDIKEIFDIFVISNYPNALWKTQWHKTRPIAQTFDTIKQQLVRRGQTIHLKSLFGIHISRIGESWIEVRQTPPIKIQYGTLRNVGKRIRITQGERKTVGDFSITLHNIQGRKALITIETVFHAWEQQLISHINPKKGNITIQDMFTWSRLHREELSNLRGMCEPAYPYEAVTVHQIPRSNYETLSTTWYAPNHACSSIFIPIHIQNNKIYPSYTNPEAAQLSLNLSEKWGHKTLIPWCKACEEVFLFQNARNEQIATKITTNNTTTDYLSTMDYLIQQQAYLTEQLWQQLYIEPTGSLKNTLYEEIPILWNQSYKQTTQQIAQLYTKLQNQPNSTWYQNQLETLLISIAKSQWLTLQQYKNLEYLDQKSITTLSDIINTTSSLEKIHSLLDICQWAESIITNTPNNIKPQTEKTDNQLALTELDLLLIGILGIIVIFIIIRKKSSFN